MIKYPDMSTIKEIKYIVCDLDGTLYTTTGIVSTNTIQKLINLQQQGYVLIIATGRFYYEIEPLVEQLKLKQYGGYSVTCNGLEIHDFRNDKITTFTQLTKEELTDLINTARHFNISAYINHQQKYHFLPCSFHHTLLNIGKTIMYPIKLLVPNTHIINKFYNVNITKTLDRGITQVPKICFLGRSSNLEALKRNLSSFEYAFYPSGSLILELTHKSVGKHIAVNTICHSHNDSLANVLAFGDSGNDMDLLQQALIGVTMKNGDAKCIERANYISDYTNKQEGVLHYLNKLGL